MRIFTFIIDSNVKKLIYNTEKDGVKKSFGKTMLEKWLSFSFYYNSFHFNKKGFWNKSVLKDETQIWSK